MSSRLTSFCVKPPREAGSWAEGLGRLRRPGPHRPWKSPDQKADQTGCLTTVTRAEGGEGPAGIQRQGEGMRGDMEGQVSVTGEEVPSRGRGDWWPYGVEGAGTLGNESVRTAS